MIFFFGIIFLIVDLVGSVCIVVVFVLNGWVGWSILFKVVLEVIIGLWFVGFFIDY